MSPLLDVRDLRVSFGSDRRGTPAVDGVSLQIAEGEALGLVGESGCGKTVTALALLGLLPPSGRVHGGSSVLWAGEDLLAAKPSRLREVRGGEIAMVFQEPRAALNPVLPVGDQVAEGLRVHRRLGRAEAGRIAEALLEEVGLPDPAGCARRYPHQLSGGMCQRVAIAMALACEPRLLVADEPATALDPTVQAQIMDVLADLRERRGLAMLLITHDLGLVSGICDRVAVMYAGQVVEVGRCPAVFRRPDHPYTAALLQSLPAPDDPAAPLVPIPGRSPSPGDRPEGCRFAPRCSRVWERCRTAPPLLEVSSSPSRAARCWLAEAGPGTERSGNVESVER
jgi:oligopeptide/dipeptide ABC transporter ATP-binding protein